MLVAPVWQELHNKKLNLRRFVADIKGRVLLDTIAAVKERAGEQELSKIIKNLSGESRKVFERPILFSEWYPLDAFAEFLEVDVRETANGDREVLAKRSEKVTESQLHGVYKFFLKLGSPGFVITRISAVHKTYFRGVNIIPEIEGHSATIRYVGFRKQQNIMEFAIIGFFRKALEMSGAKQVALKFTIPIVQAGPYSELTITWQ
jgi:hypothetical protein